MIGKTIDQYSILDKLGEGGMGIVYKAQDTKLNRTVALKFLPDRVNQDPAAKARFLQEAQAAAGLNHPGICTIFAIEEHENSVFMAMEFVDGGTLRDSIHAGSRNMQTVVTTAIQIGEALQEAHSKGIVHRDIKADNIMLTSKGQAKIMDFGLARLKGALKLTRTSSTVGTLGYMAPEQIQGADADQRSDLFSFGVLLFEMMTGRLPFRGEHEAAMMYSILNERPETVRSHVPGAPDECDRIIAKALEKNPEERYQSAADMVADLKRWKRDSHLTTQTSKVAVGISAQAPASQLSPQGKFRNKRLVIGVLGAVGLVVAFFILKPIVGGMTASKKTLAVLPFTNQSEPDREYFADGITEEITTRLSSLSGIGVIARSSAWQYKGVQKSVKDIGNELGIDFVLMGTVRWSQQADQSPRVRVRPELIDVHTGLQVWGNTFDAPFKDAFAIQSDIAQQVAQALDVKLLSPEASALEQELTAVPEAYDYYLQGVEYENRSPSVTDGQIAIQHFERAVSLDPNFAAAYARLGIMHARTYWFFYDRTKERVEKARIASERALTLGPKLSVSHEAMGWYYYHARLDYDAAIKEFAIAVDLQPNNPGVSYGLAAVYRRKGNMEESLVHWRKAVTGNPRDSELERQYGETLTLQRRYEEADEHYRTANRLAPDNVSVYGERAKNLLLWKGDLGATGDIIRDGIQYGRPTSGEDEGIKFLAFKVAIMKEDWKGAEEAVNSLNTNEGHSNQFSYYPKTLLRAHIEALRGSGNARGLYERAMKTIKERLKAAPDDERAHSSLGIAYAGLGRFEEAIREGERGRDLLPLEKEAWRGAYRLIDLAHIYTLAGKKNEALSVLERLFSAPSEISGHWLRLDPTWKPLRGESRFEALVNK